jgi:hypothetical protein
MALSPLTVEKDAGDITACSHWCGGGGGEGGRGEGVYTLPLSSPPRHILPFLSDTRNRWHGLCQPLAYARRHATANGDIAIAD